MGGAVLLLTGAVVLAVADWIAVARDRPGRARWVTKPGVMVLLITAALIASTGGAFRAWLVAGLVLSMAGDVFLLLSETWFVAGLGSFLLAHVAYVVAMTRLDLEWTAGVVALVGVAAAWWLVGRSIVTGASTREPKLRVPVTAYVAVISAMVVTAALTTEPWLVAAAGTFFVSDAILGTNRFVGERSWMPVAVMVTYHLAQFCFVGFLLSR